jgi:hypothetical protein
MAEPRSAGNTDPAPKITTETPPEPARGLPFGLDPRLIAAGVGLALAVGLIIGSRLRSPRPAPGPCPECAQRRAYIAHVPTHAPPGPVMPDVPIAAPTGDPGALSDEMTGPTPRI